MRTAKYLVSAVLLLHFGVVQADALFESDQVIDITINGPFGKIGAQRDRTKMYPASLNYEDQNFEVELSVRGHTRLVKKTCKYPPLWLGFKKNQIGGTLFDHQKHIKLVVQCKARDSYADYLRSEYLAYKIYSLMTPMSFRVRWVNVTYVDGDKRRVEPAFFIERKARLAKRTGHKTSDAEKIRYAELHAEAATIATLYQYIVANPDFSFVASPEGACCHNAKLFTDEKGKYTPVPYDFDSSGLINARYAVPNKALGINKVTTRLYRGHCMHNTYLEGTRQAILSTEDNLIRLVSDDGLLGKKAKTKMTKFLKGSIEILRDDESFQSKVVKKCRGNA